MTLQKFILGDFKWNDKTFDELSPEERRLFLSYKINCEIIDEPTPDQIADIFERLNCGKPLTDNDKFYNRRESPVVSFIKNELIVHSELRESFRTLTGLNFESKTRVQLGDIVGAVVAIVTNSVACIRTSFDRIGHALYEPMTAEKKDLVITIFKFYFATVRKALNDAHITKPKKCYLKLSNMLGIWLYWRLHPDYFTTEQDYVSTINRSCGIWVWYAKAIQDGEMKKEIFESLSSGHQRNIDVEALRARTEHLMSGSFGITRPPSANNIHDDDEGDVSSLSDSDEDSVSQETSDST